MTLEQTSNKILQLFNQGDSVKKIADTLNQEKIKTERGKRWTASNVRAFIQRRAHATAHLKKEIASMKPPIQTDIRNHDQSLRSLVESVIANGSLTNRQKSHIIAAAYLN